MRRGVRNGEDKEGQNRPCAVRNPWWGRRWLWEGDESLRSVIPHSASPGAGAAQYEISAAEETCRCNSEGLHLWTWWVSRVRPTASASTWPGNRVAGLHAGAIDTELISAGDEDQGGPAELVGAAPAALEAVDDIGQPGEHAGLHLVVPAGVRRSGPGSPSPQSPGTRFAPGQRQGGRPHVAGTAEDCTAAARGGG